MHYDATIEDLCFSTDVRSTCTVRCLRGRIGRTHIWLHRPIKLDRDNMLLTTERGSVCRILNASTEILDEIEQVIAAGTYTIHKRSTHSGVL